MNILQIVSSLEEISGPANSLYLVSSGLKQNGHNVICAHYVGLSGPLVKKLETQGIDVINLNPQNRSISRLDRLKMILKLIFIVYNHKIDVIHAHTWDADCYAFLVSFFKKMNIVVTLHSRSYFDWVNAHKWKYEKLFYARCNYFICVSVIIAQEFKEKCSVPKEKVAVVYNCPLDKFFEEKSPGNGQKIRTEFDIQENEFLIGSVGNFTKFKGIIYLLEALVDLEDENFKLILVGADAANMRPGYDAFLAGRGKKIKSKVIFAGFREDVAAILDAIDLFVFPSTEEADPIALSEAMARAKPVIATRVGGIPEKIENNKNGILINLKDSGELKKAIEYCMKNKRKIIDMGKMAKIKMEDRFSYSSMIKGYEELYKK